MPSKGLLQRNAGRRTGSGEGMFQTRDVSATLMVMGKMQREKNSITQDGDAEVTCPSRSEGTGLSM